MRLYSSLFAICSLLSAPAGGAAQTTLPGTEPLTATGDFAALMVRGIDRYLTRATAESLARRLPAERERLKTILGVVDPRRPVPALELVATTAEPALLARGAGYDVFAVRWPVLEGVRGEGLLLQPRTRPIARVVALPDADWTPEMLAGLAPGVEPAAQFARRLAESGCQVVVPVLIDRRDTWSGIEGIRMTNQPHREFIYRMAFEVGRHIIGYEVQKVLALVDWFDVENSRQAAPVAVAGYGEGALLALYAAALDPRIQGALVSGYFQPREDLWKEPIYRDVWGLLERFGDAELAALIAPRRLVVEACRGPIVTGPPPETKERRGATPNGTLGTPEIGLVRKEFARAQALTGPRAAALELVESGAGGGLPGTDEALSALLRGVGTNGGLRPSGRSPQAAANLDPAPRMRRQFGELAAFTQRLVQASPEKRAAFWSKADASTPERWRQTTGFHRDYIWREVIGRLPAPSLRPNPRTRLIYDEAAFRGYEVMLDVWPDVFAYGILLVPKSLRPGERRPVVVCQHGLEGRPQNVADPKVDHRAYHRFAVRLAEEGFITYAPQNPYIGEDRYRILQRKAHPLKLSLFSFILGQHERTLEWLASLPFVDADRIGFYGLSYGGKTAVRVPPLLDGYALSICSADFNEWVWKTTSIQSRYSYMITKEYDMLEFDFANVVNYAELASLMAPRPFMVERGHRDGVAPDEWVAYEYAKVRRFYASQMKLPERTEIEFFDGPHTINGEGTFAFLRRHLRWPR